MGDGSLNMVEFPIDTSKLLQRVLDWLRPGGIAAFRVFTRPEVDVSEDDVREAATSIGWHAFRCWLNMHTAGIHGTNIPSQRQLEAFDGLFPDRAALCQATGWERANIDRTMDAYRTSQNITSYPKPSEWLSVVPPEAVNARLLRAGPYELSEHYPLLVLYLAIQ